MVWARREGEGTPEGEEGKDLWNLLAEKVFSSVTSHVGPGALI